MNFRLIKRLRKMGVMGVNRRNTWYTLMYNPRRLYSLVDDKLLTKQLAIKAGIAVPELYGIVATHHQIRDMHTLFKQYPDFVIKPSHGSGGNGVLIMSGHYKDMYRKLNGLLMSKEELNNHVSDILSGIYSLGGQPDKAMIEYRVQLHPLFENISYQGMPDIRIVVLLGVPVMSMVRLPTRMSDGKANLHRGAIGVGIDIAKGVTLTGVWKNDIIIEHPDTGISVTDIKIPKWEILLKLASTCYELTGLGYLGVDIVFDKEKGPLLLEVNARPGLNIQIANRTGLLQRLKLVEQHYRGLKNIDERISFAQKNFGAQNISPHKINIRTFFSMDW
ncbi:MAG: alpha-L-glutamate ligase-like protein [Candidatus Kuenenia sp.]|nr:alpha-L-glutamate ligase-like protein [Candidatus Kuenenia hertensis]